jgi:hypothetical protein
MNQARGKIARFISLLIEMHTTADDIGYVEL